MTACASGQSETRFAPAPSARALGTAGYVAPEISSAAPRAPVRIAQVVPAAAPTLAASAEVAAPIAPSTAVATPLRLSERPAASAPEVPAPPVRRWSDEAPRAPLPDLDEIVVTHEAPQAVRSQTASAQPPARSVLPPARRAAPVSRGGRSADYALHLASYREPAQALAGWDVLTREHPQALSDLAPARAAVDLEGRGRFHRLIAGPLPEARADATCAALEDEGAYCAVVRWDGTPL